MKTMKQADPVDYINSLVEGAGATVRWRGNTCEVRNASGKRVLGEVFRRQDGTWGSRLSTSSVIGAEIKAGLDTYNATLTPAAGDSAALLQRRAAEGTLALHYTDDQILDAVRAGVLTESQAMNQDF